MSKPLSIHDQQAREARRAVAIALRSGELERQPCVECGAPAEAHHHLGYDPGHWLDVEWLCRPHHSGRHFLSTQKWAAVKWQRGLPMTLPELRALRGMTQVEVAQLLGIAQGNVSAFERREDVTVTNLRAYIEALGGRLEIRAILDDEQKLIAIG